MPRKRSPDRDKARQLWEADKARPLTSIASELGVPEVRIRKWKYEDQWERDEKGTYRNAQKERAQAKKIDVRLAAKVEENDELTERQKLFCLFYVKSFNATRSYQKAYGCSYENAMSEGCRMSKLPKIISEIQRLKAERNLALMADINDLVEMHMRIAFSDITDFVEFGRAEVPVMNMFGPIMTKDADTGEEIALMREVNEVRFRESVEVDGRLISEVKQGKDGASVKLVDRQKSLAFLERWFEANPMDKHRREYDIARLALEKQKAAQGKPGPDDDETGVVQIATVLPEASDE